MPELKRACDCRKPGTGMIEQAARDLNIDLAQSWMVGDTSTDMEAARRAGLRSVLVRTGFGGADGKHAATPLFTVADLPEAVAVILRQEAA